MWPGCALATSGVVMGQVLVIALKFGTFKGYLRQVLWRMWFLLILYLAFQSILAIWVVNGIGDLRCNSSTGWLLCLLAGVVLGASPPLLQLAVLGVVQKFFPTSKTGAKFVARFHVAVMFFLQQAEQRSIEKDNIDFQNGVGSWRGIGAPKELGRKIRLIFQKHQERIAVKDNNQSALKMDSGVYPGGLFYLLIRHLGRGNLLSIMKTEQVSPPPSESWDGQERRRKTGSVADRKKKTTNGHTRRSDDPGYWDRVRSQQGNL